MKDPPKKKKNELKPWNNKINSILIPRNIIGLQLILNVNSRMPVHVSNYSFVQVGTVALLGRESRLCTHSYTVNVLKFYIAKLNYAVFFNIIWC